MIYTSRVNDFSVWLDALQPHVFLDTRSWFGKFGHLVDRADFDEEYFLHMLDHIGFQGQDGNVGRFEIPLGVHPILFYNQELVDGVGSLSSLKNPMDCLCTEVELDDSSNFASDDSFSDLSF
jgi:hypothetical protein